MSFIFTVFTQGKPKKQNKTVMEKKRKGILRRRRAAAAADDLYHPQPQPPKFSGDDLTEVSDLLKKCGYGLKTDMLADYLQRLGDSIDGFQEFHVRKKAIFCTQILLFSDLNSCGSGILPTDVKLHKTLPGQYVLQVSISISISISILFHSVNYSLCSILQFIVSFLLNLLHHFYYYC